MGLIDIVGQLRIIRDDLKAGTYVKATRDAATLTLAFCDLAEAMGFQAGPDDAKHAKEIKSLIDECCDLAAHPPAGATFGKWGDGKFLAGLLALLKELAPIIIPLIIH